VRAIVAASLLVTTLLSAATAHARDVGDDPVPVVVDDGQDQVVGTVLSDPPSPDVSVVDPRVACIEQKESGGANVWNRGGSGAGGVLQYFPSTFRRGALEMGHPEWSLWVPWQARLVAAHDLQMGRRRQWVVSGC
jgi:hypothetical protein